MKNRTIAILNENRLAVENAKAMRRRLADYLGTDVYVFTRWPEQYSRDDRVIAIPAEADTRPKCKNFVTRYFKDGGSGGTLHLLEDRLDILKNPLEFMDRTESLMSVMGVNNWCSTELDTCNHIYRKFVTRLKIRLDEPGCEKLGVGDELLFCSHSNVQWIVFDLDKADADELYFDESYEIDMYWIIEFLARRRNAHPGSMYFMNQYMTLPCEHGVFGFSESAGADDGPAPGPDQFQKEDQIFKSRNVNYQPDNDIDAVLEKTWLKIRSGLGV